MPPSDDTPYPLAAPQSGRQLRRSIAARDYALPKPYRKKKFVDEDAPPLSRLRVSLLTFSGLVVAGLVVALVLLAKENLDSPPLPVIAATVPTEPEAAIPARGLPRAALLPAALQTPMPPSKGVHLSVPRPRPGALVPHLRKVSTRFLPPHMPIKTEAPAPAPDRDVVLITTILLLTPPSPPDGAVPEPAVCTGATASDSGCPAIHGMKP